MVTGGDRVGVVPGGDGAGVVPRGDGVGVVSPSAFTQENKGRWRNEWVMGLSWLGRMR